MREIPLSRGLVAIVDDEDYERLMAFQWYANEVNSGRWYARRSDGSRKFYMHREIAGATHGQHVDHANRNTLDNRTVNLRLATRSQNGANATGRGGTSAFNGVSWCKQTRRWRAQIERHDRHLHIGRYDSEFEAARAYDVVARDLFGAFALVNFQPFVADRIVA